MVQNMHGMNQQLDHDTKTKLDLDTPRSSTLKSQSNNSCEADFRDLGISISCKHYISMHIQNN
jgi:hypothetical protein